MLIALKPESLGLLEIPSTGLYRLFRIWGEGKIVEIIFLQVGFHG
jgi:hypothetical protein